MPLRVPKRRAFQFASVFALAAGSYTLYNGVRDPTALQQNIGTVAGGAIGIIAGIILASMSARAGRDEMLTLER